jgi:hypothetical protein
VGDLLVGALLILPLALAATAIVRLNRPLSDGACRRCGAAMGDTSGLGPRLDAGLNRSRDSQWPGGGCPACGGR